MDRRERDQYDNRSGYGAYDDYRGDSHYHSARNLTDEFEQEYRRERGNDSRPYNQQRSYHEGDMGDAYERLSRERNRGGNADYDTDRRNQQSRYPENSNRQRDRYSNYQDDYRSFQDNDRSNRFSDDRNTRGDVRRGYGISDYEGTSDRYNTLNRNDDRYDTDRGSYYNSGNTYSTGNYSSGNQDDSYLHSDRGVPNYGTSSFADDYGSDLNRTYRDRNYNSGSDYESGQRGRMFGNYSGSDSGDSDYYGNRDRSDRSISSRRSNRGDNDYSRL